MSRGSGGVAVALASVTIAAIGLSAPAGAGGERGSETVLANHCFAIQAIASGRYVESTDGAYAARAPGAGRAERFWFKPTSLDPTYMLSDRQGRLMAGEGRSVTATTTPGREAEWGAVYSDRGASALVHARHSLELGERGALKLGQRGLRDFRLVPTGGCQIGRAHV